MAGRFPTARGGLSTAIENLAENSALGPLCWRPASLYMPLVGPWRSLVSASVWGAEGREFESRRPDHSENAHPRPGVGVSFCRKGFA